MPPVTACPQIDVALQLTCKYLRNWNLQDDVLFDDRPRKTFTESATLCKGVLGISWLDLMYDNMKYNLGLNHQPSWLAGSIAVLTATHGLPPLAQHPLYPQTPIDSAYAAGAAYFQRMPSSPGVKPLRLTLGPDCPERVLCALNTTRHKARVPYYSSSADGPPSALEMA